MLTKRKVGTPLRILCVLISPFLIYMTWRMNKVRKALAVIAIDIVISSIIEHFMPFPFGTIVELAFSLPFIIYFVNKWASEWNKSIDEEQKMQPSSV